LKRKIITTGDGSKTIQIEAWNEQYHSTHGAIQEAYHVFLKNGLNYVHQLHNPLQLSILEIGFGTGLNAFITCLESEGLNVKVNYVGVEAYPVVLTEISQLNYSDMISPNNKGVFNDMHECPWEYSINITPNFKLIKRKQFFSEIKDKHYFDIIYFDAFGPRVQPELWTEQIFQLMFHALKETGVLVTYSAKGSARRAMISAGFSVEKLQGPPGKRHMLRATKQNANNAII
jgi:tRNA U34 5-methylaminomethyl-2-thiouridine-forming methyltransferase MnmC